MLEQWYVQDAQFGLDVWRHHHEIINAIYALSGILPPGDWVEIVTESCLVTGAVRLDVLQARLQRLPRGEWR